MTKKIFYKIRRKSDGKFSNGGTHPDFTAVGKVWRRRQDLVAHLECMMADWLGSNYWKEQIPKELPSTYRDCELVAYEVIERETSSETLQQMVTSIAERKNERFNEQQARRAFEAREERRKMYEQLKSEFEDD